MNALEIGYKLSDIILIVVCRLLHFALYFNESMSYEQFIKAENRKQLPSYPTKSLREYLAYRSVQNSQLSDSQFNHVELFEPPSDTLRFEIELEVDEGRSEVIFVNEYTDFCKEAKIFCEKYELDESVEDLLAKTMKEKYEKEKCEVSNEHLAKECESLTQVYSNVRAREVLLTNSDSETIRYHKGWEVQKIEEDKGANRLFNRYKNKKYSLGDTYLLENKENQPQINRLSKQICSKLGKQKILQQKRQKSQQKFNTILLQRQLKQEQQMRKCPFKPKINLISKQVDRQKGDTLRQQRKVQRYQKLYEDHRNLQLKKQYERENHYQQISFRPMINNISRRIVQSKKMMNSINSMGEDKSMLKSHTICGQSNSNSLPHTGRAPKNRNLDGLPIGEYLYNQARKKSKVKRIDNKVQVRANEHSQHLLSVLKQKRLNQIFFQLTSPPHCELTCSDIKLSLPHFKFGKYKPFMPIFNEMIQMDIGLTKEQFIDACLKLFKTLSPNEKHQIIFWKEKEKEQDEQPQVNVSMNSKGRSTSKRSIHEKGDIYNRGLQHKKLLQQKIQKNREDMVREQLKQCTFRPICK